MIRKAVRRAAVWTAGAGLVMAPMSMMGPQFTLAACTSPDYPAPIATQTEVSIGDTVGRYGNPNRVFVDVDGADSEQAPPGSVDILVDGQYYTTLINDQDVVSTNLRRNLKARATYEIEAEYTSECPYADSSGNSAFYTVQRGQTSVDPRVRNGRKARFASTVDGSEGFHPQGGKMRFQVRRQGRGRVIRSRTVNVRNAFATVDLKNLRRGRYTIRTRFMGNNNFAPGQKTESFRVR